jgi:hypothetical protein
MQRSSIAEQSDGRNVLEGEFSYDTDYSGDDPLLAATFTDVHFGDGEHEGRVAGEIDLPLRSNGDFNLVNLDLAVLGDPFEFWTEQENEFLVTVQLQDFHYSEWTGKYSDTLAWTSSTGHVELGDGTAYDLGVWSEMGQACFETLPFSRIEVEDGEIDVTIEPSDWEACTGCWDWRDDLGESGELCLSDLL